MCIYFKLCELWHSNPEDASTIMQFIEYTFKNRGNIPNNCHCIGIPEITFTRFFEELSMYV